MQLSPRPGLDPLRASTPLPFQHVLFPFGFAAQIKCNEPEVIRGAELSWAAFRPRFRENPIEIRVLVSDTPSARRPAVPIFRAQSNLLAIVADAHNFASCDLSAGSGFACVTAAVVKNSDYFRFNFLEAMIYSLLDTRHCVAIHAACVEKCGRGFLLVGDSGAGKSTLAYACARRGWTYVSDDATFIVRSGNARTAVGNSQSFRFRPAASCLFPELRAPVRLRNGKPTMEIKTEQLRRIKVDQECNVDFVVFLNRSADESAPVQLEAITRETALRRLLQNPWPSELAVHEQRLHAVERLLEAKLFGLTYSAIDPAIELLEKLSCSDDAHALRG